MVTQDNERFGLRARSGQATAALILAGTTLLMIAPIGGLNAADTVDQASGKSGSAATHHARNRTNTGMADPAALVTAFDRYLSGLGAGGEARFLVMPLTGLRGLTSESLDAGGTLAIDFSDGSVVSQVTGLDGEFELWVADNQPASGNSTLADASDVFLKVGAYRSESGAHVLSVLLGPDRFSGFIPDRAFVVRAGRDPVSAFVLTGANALFDRLYRRQVRLVDTPDATIGFDPTNMARRAAAFTTLIARGRELFIDEQFNGNGRTCGTCHVESNNFTIDPEFISTLPHDDPLFVAENNPALMVNFEKPALLRELGLFVENVDGLDDLQNKFTLRASQSLLGMGISLTRPDPTFGIDFTSNGKNSDPPERLGWGNDGLPTREFAIGAIVQHATRTTERRPGVDFRLPTDDELDALAAYQLALGRQEEFDLPSLELKSLLAIRGKEMFLDTGTLREPGHKNCNACHFNAGGTAGMSFNTGTPGFPRLDGAPRGFNMSAHTNANQTPLAISLGLPRDGGFGLVPTALGGFGNMGFFPRFGFELPQEEFNSTSLVESADTAPFFHNHTVSDLESAVAFYGIPAFQDDPISIGAGPIPVEISSDPNDPEVLAISAFLRALNALENIRSSISVAQRGQSMSSKADAHELAALAQADTVDAIEVLSQGAFAGTRERGVRLARAQLSEARQWLALGQRLPTRAAVNIALKNATRHLRSAREALAKPGTLPASYRN